MTVEDRAYLIYLKEKLFDTPAWKQFKEQDLMPHLEALIKELRTADGNNVYRVQGAISAQENIINYDVMVASALLVEEHNINADLPV
jgi:hypothetical protein